MEDGNIIQSMSRSISTPGGKKVSLFKKERAEKNESEDISTTVSPFRGDVVESTPTDPVVRDIICSASGFPTMKLGSRRALGATKKQKGCNRAIEERTIVEHHNVASAAVDCSTKASNDVNSSDFEADNLHRVLAMSSEEYEQSMQELASIFPESTLDFLRNRGEQRLSAKTPPSDTQPDAAPNKSQLVSSSAQLPAMSNYIARDAEELRRQVLQAPITIQRALAWTLGDDVGSPTDDIQDVNTTINPTPPAPAMGRSSRDLLPSSAPPPPVSLPVYRFDLQGARVIASNHVTLPEPTLGSRAVYSIETYRRHWIEILAHSFLARHIPHDTSSGSVIEGSMVCASEERTPWGVCSCLTSLADICAKAMITTGFVVVVGGDGEEGGGLVPELEHHEFDHGSPGYTLIEVCEVRESDCKVQNLHAVLLLCRFSVSCLV